MSGRLASCLAAALLSAVAILPGCAPAEAPSASGPVTLIDDSGDTLRLPAPATRVVSLIPATTEWLFAIGAGEQVVGRTSWCDYPAAALDIPDLGDGISPNLEAIVGANPDLVILYPSQRNAEVADRLADMGIPVLRLRTDLLGHMVEQILLLGRVTGRETEADAVVATFLRDLAAATRPAPTRPPSVLLLAWDQPPMVLGSGSYLSELVERAGGRNTFADLPASSGTVSLEAIASRNPDFILTSADGPPAITTRPEWRVVPAVRQGRFLHVKGSEFSRPSPRAPGAIRQLAATLDRLPDTP